MNDGIQTRLEDIGGESGLKDLFFGEGAEVVFRGVAVQRHRYPGVDGGRDRDEDRE